TLVTERQRIMPEFARVGIRDEDRPRIETAAIRQSVGMQCRLIKRGLWRRPIWCAGSEAGMRPTAMSMGRPGFECMSDMHCLERNNEVETFTSSTADQALAKCIRLG